MTEEDFEDQASLRISNFPNAYYIGKLMLNDKKTIYIRRVMGIMEFLGEAGGTYEALLLVGTFLNFIFTGHPKAL